MKMVHKIVGQIPEELEDGVLYVSMQFGTVVHRCACGCGEEVVTPLGPAEWRLTYDGRTISLAPSIGNWNFPCRSHYWIESGNVRWARGFSRTEVAQVRRKARTRRESYYSAGIAGKTGKEASETGWRQLAGKEKSGVWRSILAKIRSKRWKRTGGE